MRQFVTVLNHSDRIHIEPFSTANMQIYRLAPEREIPDDALLGKTFAFITCGLGWNIPPKTAGYESKSFVGSNEANIKVELSGSFG